MWRVTKVLARGLLIERSRFEAVSLTRSAFSRLVLKSLSSMSALPLMTSSSCCWTSDSSSSRFCRNLTAAVFANSASSSWNQRKPEILDPVEKRFWALWKAANLLHILQVFYISYQQVIEHVLYLMLAIKLTIMKSQTLFGLFCP